MKKIISIILSVVMVVGLCSIALAAPSDDRITGAIKPIDRNAPNRDLYGTAPGTKIQFPLTADMFSWRSGRTAPATEAVTKSDISKAGVKVVTTGKDVSLIKSASIKFDKTAISDGRETAIVEVEFVNPLVSTSEKSFNVNIYLQIGNRQQDSMISLNGSLQNPVIQLYAGDKHVSIAGGKVLEVVDGVRNVDIAIGKDIYVLINAIVGQKYYAYVSTDVNSKDEQFIRNNPSITDVFHLSTIYLQQSGKYVDFTRYQNRWIYNANGAYLGKSSDLVAYSDTYYLSNKDLGATLSGGTSGGGGGNTDNGNTGGGSTGGGSTGGGSSNGAVQTGGVIDVTLANKLALAAVSDAKYNGSAKAVVKTKNSEGITTQALTAISTYASNAGYKAQVQADTSAGGKVIGRIYINPANAKGLNGTIKLGLQNNNKNVVNTKAMFEKKFKNNIAVVSFDHNGPFGMTVSAAALVNLSKLNTKNLYLYSYNRSTNKYYAITNSGAYIDSAGYLRFSTTNGGDIVISDGPLTVASVQPR